MALTCKISSNLSCQVWKTPAFLHFPQPTQYFYLLHIVVFVCYLYFHNYLPLLHYGLICFKQKFLYIKRKLTTTRRKHNNNNSSNNQKKGSTQILPYTSAFDIEKGNKGLVSYVFFPNIYLILWVRNQNFLLRSQLIMEIGNYREKVR